MVAIIKGRLIPQEPSNQEVPFIITLISLDWTSRYPQDSPLPFLTWALDLFKFLSLKLFLLLLYLSTLSIIVAWTIVENASPTYLLASVTQPLLYGISLLRIMDLISRVSSNMESKSLFKKSEQKIFSIHVELLSHGIDYCSFISFLLALFFAAASCALFVCAEDDVVITEIDEDTPRLLRHAIRVLFNQPFRFLFINKHLPRIINKPLLLTATLFLLPTPLHIRDFRDINSINLKLILNSINLRMSNLFTVL